MGGPLRHFATCRVAVALAAAVTCSMMDVAEAACDGLAEENIGISYSGRGSEDYIVGLLPCYYCTEVKRAVDHWKTYVNQRTSEFCTQDGKSLRLFVQHMDDHGNATLCEENYDKLANDKINGRPMLALLGPSFAGFNSIAVRAAKKHNKTLILWSFSYMAYVTLPGAESFDRFGAEAVAAWPKALPGAQSQGCAVGGVGCPINLTNDLSINGDEGFWNEGLDNVFDINIPRTEWAYGAIKKVYDKGAREMLFLYGHEDEVARQRCLALRAYVIGTFTDTRTGHQSVSTFPQRDKIDELNLQHPNVVVFCGEMWDVTSVIVIAKAFNLDTQAVILDSPMGSMLVDTIRAFNANYLIEPLPMTYNLTQKCEVFRTTTDFLLEGDFPSGTGFAALQVGAAGAVLTAAIRELAGAGVELDDAKLQVDLRRQLRSRVTDTIWGPIEFGASGRRVNAIAGTRQFLPLTDSEYSDYNYSNIKVVDSQERERCATLPEITIDCNNTFTELTYPKPTWVETYIEVYPCEAGCELGQGQCKPCAQGKFRRDSDIDCRDCSEGTYAAIPGLSSCVACERGGLCPDPAFDSVPEEGYYRIVTSNGTVGQSTTSSSQATDDISPECANVSSQRLLQPRFEPCRPTTVCLEGKQNRSIHCVGSNTGLLCGQCPTGETYSGPLAGRRTCRKCWPHWVVVLCTVALFCFYGCLAWFMSTIALRSAFDASSLPCSLLRTLLHYLQVLGIVLEGLRLDTHPVLSIVAVPLGLLTRPFDFIQLGCLAPEPTTTTMVQYHAQAAKWIIPIGLVAVMVAHCVRGLGRYVYVFGDLTAKGIRIMRRGFSEAKKGVSKIEGEILEQAEQMVATTRNFRMSSGPASRAGSPDTPQEEQSDAPQRRSFRERVRRGMDSLRDAIGVSSGAASSQAPEGEDLSEEFHLLFGPGAAFSRLHEGFSFKKNWWATRHEQLALLLFLYPVVLRCCMQALDCVDVQFSDRTEKRLVADLDVICGSPEHLELSSGMEALLVMVGFGVPLVVCLCLWQVQDAHADMESRRKYGLLCDGYSPNCVRFGEVMMLLRLFLVIWLAYGSVLSTRGLLLVVLMACSIVVNIEVQPFDFRDRQALHYLDLLGLLMVCLTSVLGMAANYEGNGDIEETAGRYLPQDLTVRRWLVACVIILVNVWVVGYALVTLIYNTISLKIQLFVHEDEGCVDAAAMRFHWFIKRFFRGLNVVGHVMRDGRHYIDVSQLDDNERWFLGLSLSETLSACMDSVDAKSGKFHSWLLENALHEAFLRARQARAARLRAIYSTYGSRPFYLISFPFFHLFRVTLRPPDIPVKKPREGPDDVGAEGLGDVRSSVTVEELYYALSSVNVDVLEKHPTLHTPRVEDQRGDVDHSNEKATHVMTWKAGAPLKFLEWYGVIHSTEHSTMQDDYEYDGFEEPEIFKQLKQETDDIRTNCEVAGQHRELEEEVAALLQEVEDLRSQLRESGGETLEELDRRTFGVPPAASTTGTPAASQGDPPPADRGPVMREWNR